MTEREIDALDWSAFNARFVIRIEKDCANVWIVPKTDTKVVEFRLEGASGRTFACCKLTKNDIEKILEKLQKAMKELE